MYRKRFQNFSLCWIFSLFWYLFFLTSKKKSTEKCSIKIVKVQNSYNFERLKMVLWKHFREENSLFYYFPHFLRFFALWISKWHTNGMKHDNPLFFTKMFTQKTLDVLQKFNQCYKKFPQQFFGTRFISKEPRNLP